MKILHGILAAIAGFLAIFTVGKKGSKTKKEQVKKIKSEIKEAETKVEEKVEENKKIREEIKEKDKTLEALKKEKELGPKETDESSDDIFNRLKARANK